MSTKRRSELGSDPAAIATKTCKIKILFPMLKHDLKATQAQESTVAGDIKAKSLTQKHQTIRDVKCLH